MRFKLVEPLRQLFKDEVRAVGAELGLDDEFVWRQPFPGPGLAVRILGEVDRLAARPAAEADAIVAEEVKRGGLVPPAVAVLRGAPAGPERRRDGGRADLRVHDRDPRGREQDGMTADWARLPHDLLATIASRIVNEVKGINRVVYDVSSKPPSTIEWE